MIGIIVAISMSAIGCGKDVNKLQADEAIQKYLERDSGDDLLNKIKKKAPPSLERANGGARSVSTPPGTWADKRCQRHT